MGSTGMWQQRFKSVPPLKGSFPLDHEGTCRPHMLRYMICLEQKLSTNSKCRELSKEYFRCRMDHELMAKEEWPKLGFGPDSSGENVNGTGANRGSSAKQGSPIKEKGLSD